MSKLEKHWFKHDMNASQDSKLQKLEFKYPLKGYAIFFKLVEVLMLNDGSVENNLEMLSYQLRVDDLEMLRAVVNDYGLFVVDDAIISNDRVLNQLSEITQKSSKAKESAIKKHTGDYENELSKLGMKVYCKKDDTGFYHIYFKDDIRDKEKLSNTGFDSPEQAEPTRYEFLKKIISNLKKTGKL
jgi:hypothetical protein